MKNQSYIWQRRGKYGKLGIIINIQYMSFSETQEFSRFDDPEYKKPKPWEEADGRKVDNPSGKWESLDPKNAGKLKEWFGSLDKKLEWVSLNWWSNRLSAKIKQQELLDREEANSMKSSFNDPRVGFPPIEIPNGWSSTGITNTSSGYAKVNIWWTEWGYANETIQA